jgi:hypothetical protein
MVFTFIQNCGTYRILYILQKYEEEYVVYMNTNSSTIYAEINYLCCRQWKRLNEEYLGFE